MHIYKISIRLLKQVQSCTRLLQEKVKYLLAQGHSKAPPFLTVRVSIDENKVQLSSAE